jgi:cytochrome P450
MSDVGLQLFAPLVDDALATFCATSPVEADPARVARAFSAAMSTVSTHMLVAFMFGASGEARDQLEAGLRDLGPHGLVWNLGPRQFAAYRELYRIARDVLALPDGVLDAASPAVVIHRAGALDDTMLGNLIHMTEMGRQDTANLLRWATRTVATVPGLADAVRTDDNNANAVMWEILRHHQSERLERLARVDLTFDGYSIPAGTRVRLCMWESHHDTATFPDPMRFDWTRFTDKPPSTEVFSPFGLDEHQCPFGSLSMQVGATFLRRLTRGYDVTLLADGPPVRGAYHWEPARAMAPRLEARV